MAIIIVTQSTKCFISFCNVERSGCVLKIAKKKLQRLPRERVHLIFYSGLSLNSSYSQKYIPGYEMFQILRNSFLESRFFEDVFVLALESFSGCVLEVLPPTASEISSPSSHRLLFVHISFVHELIRLPSRVGTIFRFLLQVTCLECVPRPALISSIAPHVRKDRRMTEGRMGRWASCSPDNYRRSHHPCDDLPITNGHLLAWSTKAEIYNWRRSNNYWTKWNSMCSEKI